MKKINKETSILIQRLHKPHKSEDGNIGKLGKSLAFGGGPKNGGISDEVMEIISQIFSFDYMGACEFEHGSVPIAMLKIAKNSKKYISESFEVKTKEGQYKNVHVICHKDIKGKVMNWIQIKAFDEYDGSHTHEIVGLNRSINSCGDHPVVGWLELDNGFFFFIDEKMFNKAKVAFKIK